MAITLAEARRQIAGAISDYVPFKATALGTTTVGFDATRLTLEPGAYAGMDWIATAGTAANIGLDRYVQASSEGNQSITLSLPLPAVIAIADEADLVNWRGIGLRAHEYRSIINQAIREAQGHTVVPLTATVGPFDSNDSPQLSLPSSLRYVWNISYTDSEGIVRWPDRGSRHADNGWWFDGDSGIIRFGGSLPWEIDGLSPTVHGFGVPGTLTDDTETTPIPADWLLAKGVVLAITRLAERGRSDLATQIGLWVSEESQAKRGLRPGPFPPNTVRNWSAT